MRTKIWIRIKSSMHVSGRRDESRDALSVSLVKLSLNKIVCKWGV